MGTVDAFGREREAEIRANERAAVVAARNADRRTASLTFSNSPLYWFSLAICFDTACTWSRSFTLCGREDQKIRACDSLRKPNGILRFREEVRTADSRQIARYKPRSGRLPFWKPIWRTEAVEISGRDRKIERAVGRNERPETRMPLNPATYRSTNTAGGEVFCE